MDLVAIRRAIVDTLKASSTFDGWEGFPWVVDQFPAPAFFVTDPTNWQYDTDFSGHTSFTLAIRLAFPRDNEVTAHQTISQLISNQDNMPKKLLEGNPDLSGTVDSIAVQRVSRMTRYRAAAGSSYLGAEIEIDIVA